MPEPVLHVGMGKAASTYLQRWFSHQPEILSLRETTNLRDAICDLALELMRADTERERIHQALSAAREAIRFPQAIPVLSEERFTGWQGNAVEVPLDYDLAAFRRNVATLLRELFPVARVLIVTRSFTASLRSSYSQYIVSGGRKTFHQYIRDQRGFILESWRFGSVAVLYAEIYGAEKVKLIPFELLRDEPDRFMDEISRFLRVRRPVAFPNERLNPSVGPHELRFLRHLNGLAWRLSEDAAQFELHQRSLRQMVTGYVSGKDAYLDRMRCWLERNSRPEELDIPIGFWKPIADTLNVVADNPLYARYMSEYLQSG